MQKTKKEVTIVRKMLIALVAGLVVGIGCLLLRESLLSSGNEGVWNMINSLLFQDISKPEGVKALGLFYIVSQIFMNGLQLAIVPLVLVSISLAMCSISEATKLGRIAGRSLAGFLAFYAVGCAVAGAVAYVVKNMGLFSVVLPGEAAAETVQVAPYNPLGVLIDAIPNNIVSVCGVNTRILAVVVVAVIMGICMNKLGERGKTLKEVLETLSEIINMWLTFLLNKIGPYAIFCMISRTFAVYGVEYLKPAAAYMVTTILVLFLVLLTVYPIGIFIATGLNPMKFVRKMAKVGVFGFAMNSSAATLPINTRTNLDELGCSEEITSFILPLGMTINMNGTSIMHMVAVTFIATTAGIEITPSILVVMALLTICASAGTPAIPVAGTTMIFTVMAGLGFTTDACLLGYALVVAINRPVEMSLLTLNVIGDAAVNVIVNAKEGMLNKDVYNS
ncbi:MAG: dicarboxylate/amino acid:cation symporter [Clostridiales bacterium]|nr:dicarboxylate/amino acid:cation symporter [Clostridiales bacterium]